MAIHRPSDHELSSILKSWESAAIPGIIDKRNFLIQLQSKDKRTLPILGIATCKPRNSLSVEIPVVDQRLEIFSPRFLHDLRATGLIVSFELDALMGIENIKRVQSRSTEALARAVNFAQDDYTVMSTPLFDRPQSSVHHILYEDRGEYRDIAGLIEFSLKMGSDFGTQVKPLSRSEFMTLIDC